MRFGLSDMTGLDRKNKIKPTKNIEYKKHNTIQNNNEKFIRDMEDLKNKLAFVIKYN